MVNSEEVLFYEFARKKAQDAKFFEESNIVTAADFFEWCVDQYQDHVAIKAVDSTVEFTYRQLDEAANQVAHWAQNCGFLPGSVVALLMENRPEYLMITLGLAKAGLIIALINTTVTGNLLAHALGLVTPCACIISTNLSSNWRSFDSVLRINSVWWYGEGSQTENCQLQQLLHSFPKSRLPRQVRVSVRSTNALYYIYTSGTTGNSKAALFSHKRFIGCALTWKRPCGLTAKDRYYITLPLYHGNAGCVAVATAFFAGACIILRKKFSASNFFKDIKTFQCTATIYVGEIWRYIQLYHNQNNASEDFRSKEDYPLRVIIGNGLRPQIWKDIVDRFSISLVVEHYGATEMPGAAILNYFNKVGSCGFLPPNSQNEKDTKLIKFDLEYEQPIRNELGFCCECDSDEVGEIVFRLPNGKYEGYVNSCDSQQKIHKTVFEENDSWWASGDLLKRDANGFFWFVDRTGDTFRWKGENTSSNEVCNILQSHPLIAEANVYGVSIPAIEGRAGMASILLDQAATDEPSTLRSIYEFLSQKLPSFSWPVFIRVRREENTKTSTFKFQKRRYVEDSFDPNKCQPDSVFVLIKNEFVLIDATLHEKICRGFVRL